MTTTASPSLMNMGYVPPSAGASGTPAAAKTLLDLLYDGFLMLFLLKSGQQPGEAGAFSEKVQHFLSDFERNAKKLDISNEDVHATKYAFCAAVDETVLNSNFAIREQWMLQPLQLTLFGDQLAGENFFNRLEDLRAQGAPRLQSLEVFHMCLLLGFQGKYLIEGQEKLAYLTARLGDEIINLKGKRAAFAPHWPLPDRVAHALKREVPVWALAAVFSLFGILAYLGIAHHLRNDVGATLSAYHDVVKLGPRSAHLTISLP